MRRVFGKLVLFSFITFGLGLVQAWIAILLVSINSGHFYPSRIFSDGGLFFFSASLASSSYLSLRATPNLDISYGSRANVMSLLLMASTYFLALVGYLSQAVKKPECTSFDQGILIAMQIICVFCASVYAFYVAMVSGMLRGDS
ncbi:hypothetical protein [Rugamonas sp. DEMB1]|uniref:hypothetical protein n=1 Tax=Rugamonas sp. DEMB1 TaxID=3039386 RepID=UPI00244AF951|nr:hypothetical protein [Rugamonas sp. DEMB1]WGG52504.1 hypothetical protein QC826_10365 [Rugamonas sp. DEMB1]